MPVTEVGFALERFAWRDGALEVAGRWSGVEERRLRRPVLSVVVDGRRQRLSALRGEDGRDQDDRWQATFLWDGDPGDISEAELDVGRSLVVELPAPSRRSSRSLRAEAALADAAPTAARMPRAEPEPEPELAPAPAAPEPDPHGPITAAPGPGDAAAVAAAAALAAERDAALAAAAALAAQRDEAIDRASADHGELAGRLEEAERAHAEAQQDIAALRSREEHLAGEIDLLRQAIADAATEAEQHLDAMRTAQARAEAIPGLEAELAAVRARAAAVPALEAELERVRAEIAAAPAEAPGAPQETRPFTPIELDDAVAAAPDAEPPPIPRRTRPRPPVPERAEWEDAAGALPGPSGAAFTATEEHAALQAEDEAEGEQEVAGGERPGAGVLRALRAAADGARGRRAAGDDAGDADRPAEGESAGQSVGAATAAMVERVRAWLAPAGEGDSQAPASPSLRAARAAAGRDAMAGRRRSVDARRAAVAARRTPTTARGRAPAATVRAGGEETSWALRGLAIAVVIALLVALLLLVSALA